MHTSRLSTFVIDCKAEDLEEAARFWTRALRRELKPVEPGDEKYRVFKAAPSEVLLMLQAVEHPSRIHVDIESDDIPAEVARLEGLGAKRIEQIRTWTVMEAPTGQRFCVVRPQRGPLELARELPPALEALPGHYDGQTKVWADPSGAPDLSSSELHIAPVCGGRWLRLEERGSFAGQARAGDATLGFHRDAQRFEMSWIDTFHTGTAVLCSSGAPRADGVIAVTGTYAANGESWGWRTEIDARAGLCTRAFNISPRGEEQIAVETHWTR